MRNGIPNILAKLSDAYGLPEWKSWGKALDVLVETILSQNTSNANSSAGYRHLRSRFKSWNKVADAPTSQVEETIRISGLSRIKAPRIQNILRQIRQSQSDHPTHDQQAPAEPSCPDAPKNRPSKTQPAKTHTLNPHGLSAVAAATRKTQADLSLEFLKDWPLEQADTFLQSFDGVGPKTAACVLMFSFNMPIFPVDTHIHRIAIRLGLVPEKASAEDTQKLLTPLIRPADRYAMHILLISHGRKTCRAISPKCEWCNLRTRCPHAKREQRKS